MFVMLKGERLLGERWIFEEIFLLKVCWLLRGLLMVIWRIDGMKRKLKREDEWLRSDV